MNKGELIEKMAQRTELSKKDCDLALTAAIDLIREATAAGDKTTLVGFGSFEARQRKEREGRNPKTGETMTIPACKIPAFSAGKQFKELVKSA